MSPRARHLLWCIVFLLASAAFIVTGLALGAGIDWDLARTISNGSRVFQGERTGPAWAVIPGLLLVGAAGMAVSFWLLRLPAEEDQDVVDDEWDDAADRM